MNQKGFAPIFLVVLALVVLGASGGAYYYLKSSEPVPPPAQTSKTETEIARNNSGNDISPKPAEPGNVESCRAGILVEGEKPITAGPLPDTPKGIIIKHMYSIPGESPVTFSLPPTAGNDVSDRSRYSYTATPSIMVQISSYDNPSTIDAKMIVLADEEKHILKNIGSFEELGSLRASSFVMNSFVREARLWTGDIAVDNYIVKYSLIPSRTNKNSPSLEDVYEYTLGVTWRLNNNTMISISNPLHIQESKIGIVVTKIEQIAKAYLQQCPPMK